MVSDASPNADRSAIIHDTWEYRDRMHEPIFAQRWVPERPHAAIQVIHGIGEHSSRYDPFARFLAEHGFAVYAEDHRGHGRTAQLQYGTEHTRFGQLGPGGLRATERAVADLTRHIQERHPDLPVGVYAHSWGSLMTQRMLQRPGAPWRAVVLAGTAMRTLRFMETGDTHRQFPGPTGYEWLSRVALESEAYLNDPLTYVTNVPQQLGFADVVRLFGTPKRGVPNVPMLIIGGSADALSKRDGRERLAAAYRRVGVEDVTVQIYPGGRHDLLLESNKAEVYRFVTDWFLEKLREQREQRGQGGQRERKERKERKARRAR